MKKLAYLLLLVSGTAYAQGIQPDSSYFFTWKTNQWNLYSIDNYAYSSGRLSGKMTRYVNPSPTTRLTQFAYDAQGNVITETYKLADTVVGFKNVGMTSRIYDTMGRVLSTRNYNWVSNPAGWQFYMGDSTSYETDMSGNVVARTQFDLYGAATPTHRFTFHNYNTAGEPRMYIQHDWNGSGWDSVTKFDSVEWASGFDWITATGPTAYLLSWHISGSFQHRHTAWSEIQGGKPVRQYGLELNGSTWDSSYRSDFFYDGQGKRYKTHYNLYASGWEMSAGMSDSSHYGAMGEVLETQSSEYQTGQGWFKITRRVYYYTSTSIEPLETSRLLLYPNPASSTVRIQAEGLESAQLLVLDLSGRTVLSVSGFSSGEELDISALAPGCYVIRAVSGSRVYEGRIMH